MQNLLNKFNCFLLLNIFTLNAFAQPDSDIEKIVESVRGKSHEDIKNLIEDAKVRAKVLKFVPKTPFYSIPANSIINSPPNNKPFPRDDIPSNHVYSIYRDEQLGLQLIGHDSGLTIKNLNSFENDTKTTVDGLPSNRIKEIAYIKYQQQDLFLLGTDNGLSIYNGQSFTNKTKANGLASDDISSIFVANGKIYVGSDDGLSISTNGGHSFKTVENVKQTFDIYASDNDVFVATDDGFFVSNDGGLTFAEKLLDDDLERATNTYSVFKNDNKIYVVDSAGLWISKDNGVTFEHKLQDESFDNFYDVFARGQNIYVSGTKGMKLPAFKFSDNGGETFSDFNLTLGDEVIALGFHNDFRPRIFPLTAPKDPTTRVFLTTGNGYLTTSLQGGSSIENHISQRSGLPDNDIVYVYADDKNIFVATNGGVAAQSQDNGETFIAHSRNIDPRDRTRAFFPTNDKLFLVTSSGVLTRPYDADFSAEWTSLNDNEWDATSIAALDKHVYIGTREGLFISHDGGENFKLAIKRSIRSIHAGKSLLLVGTEDGIWLSPDNGEKFIHRTIGRFFERSHKGRKFAVKSVMSSDKSHFVGTDFGLFKLATMKDESKEIDKLSAVLLITGDISSMGFDGKSLYVGTNDGLLISNDDGQNFYKYTTAQGLGSNVINTIFANDKEVLIGTRNGLQKLWK